MKQTFSIIINNYNYGLYVGDAIRTALNQDCGHPVDIIVVDDGSSDGSEEVIQSFGERIKPVFKANGGQASALNAGFRKSKGKWVLFLDADDMLLPNTVHRLSRALRDSIARLHFLLDAVDSSGRRLGKLIGGAVLPDATEGPFGVASPTSGNLFSAEVLEKVMPIPEKPWRICADVYLAAVSSLFGEVLFLPERLALYRVHGRNNVQGKAPDLASVRAKLSRDLSLHESLRCLAPEKIGGVNQWLGRFPQHWVRRLTSLREGPSDHPWDDKLPDLMGKAVSATWRHPYWNFRRKLLYSGWVLAYALSSEKIARKLKDAERCRRSLARHLLGQ